MYLLAAPHRIEATDIILGGGGLDEVGKVLAKLSGREQRADLVDVKTLVGREQVMVGDAVRIATSAVRLRTGRREVDVLAQESGDDCRTT